MQKVILCTVFFVYAKYLFNCKYKESLKYSISRDVNPQNQIRYSFHDDAKNLLRRIYIIAKTFSVILHETRTYSQKIAILLDVVCHLCY